MYIKLTRFDNRPVWINAAFVVTVEPRRDGSGAVVVPIGDGLDYDVRESPEEVLRMLEGCPAPQVVPVPVSDCLTKTPADVSPEPERKPAVTTPAREDAGGTVTAPVTPPSGPSGLLRRGTCEDADGTVAAKPAKKAARAKKPAAAKKAKPAKKPVLELSDEEVTRLGKLAPKSIAKLKNTLSTQFRVADVSETVAALEAKGVIKLDGNHVSWTVD